MITWMKGDLLLKVALLVPPNNQKPTLTLQSAIKRSFWNKKLRATRRSLWDGGSNKQSTSSYYSFFKKY